MRTFREITSGADVGAAEMAGFLRRMPTSLPLEALYPSLRDVRRLALPWSAWTAVLVNLEALPGAVSRRWRDRMGRENLLLLERPSSADRGLGAGPIIGPTGQRSPSGGTLTHLCVSRDGASLRARACATTQTADPAELRTAVTESIAAEISCFLWEQMALPLTRAAPGGVGGSKLPHAHL